MKKYYFAVVIAWLSFAAASAGNVRSDMTRFYRNGDHIESERQPSFLPSRGAVDLSTRPPQLGGKQATASAERGKPYGGEGSNPATPDPDVDEQEDKRRKLAIGRNHETLNLTANYMSDLENETWNLGRKRKAGDFDLDQGETCKFTTNELVAIAQAAVARSMKGFCNYNDMEESFRYLESSLLKQLSTIRNMILNLEKRLGEHGDAVIYGQKQLSSAITKGCSGRNIDSWPTLTNPDVHNRNQKPGGVHDYSKPGSGSGAGSGSGSIDHIDDYSDEEAASVRDPEILKFNSSIHVEMSASGPQKKVFTYYWRIKDMAYKLSGWNPWKSFRSQSFYVFPSGYRMYMRVFPRHDEDSFNVRVGVTKGEFDESLKWPFPLRHKIHILDQTKDDRVFEDIASRIWDPNLLCSDFNWQKPVKGDNHECNEVAFPHDVLRQRDYIRKNALIIKLTVYLES